MTDDHPHHLLVQVPLTVSPYLSLPTATPLPYSYKSLPSTLPPSITETHGQPDPNDPSKRQAQYVISNTGHAAHPDAIIQSCRALQDHLTKMQDEANATLAKWQTGLRERDLAEKRRVAPGWLDVESGDRGLVPERMNGKATAGEVVDLMSDDVGGGETLKPSVSEGQALDQAFGGLSMQ